MAKISAKYKTDTWSEPLGDDDGYTFNTAGKLMVASLTVKPVITLGSKSASITINGDYNYVPDDDKDGLDNVSIHVAVDTTSGAVNKSVTIQPTGSTQVKNISDLPEGYTGWGPVTVGSVTYSGISAANIKYNTSVKVGNSDSATAIANVTGTFSGANTVSGTGVTAASAGDIMANKAAFLNGAQITGSMTINSATTTEITTQGGSYTIPAGYHDGTGVVSVSLPTASLAPTATVTAASTATPTDLTSYMTSTYVVITPKAEVTTAGYKDGTAVTGSTPIVLEVFQL